MEPTMRLIDCGRGEKGARPQAESAELGWHANRKGFHLVKYYFHLVTGYIKKSS